MFLRDPANQHRTFLLGQWSEPAFNYLKDNDWLWTEKVDGTNIRVVYDGTAVHFGGRTNDAQTPFFLMERLQALFTVEKLRECFHDVSDGVEVYLFGEGFGAKIQNGGGRYKPDGCDFILFDVTFNGLYLERLNVEDIAGKLGISVVPVVGSGKLWDAVEFTKTGYKSKVAADVGFDAEGIVLRPTCELVDRRGHRIITKLKQKDFRP
jgi:hypothetical protein